MPGGRISSRAGRKKGIIPATAVPFTADHGAGEAELTRYTAWFDKRSGIVGIMINGVGSPQPSSRFSRNVDPVYRVRKRPRRCSSGTTRSANSSKQPGV